MYLRTQSLKLLSGAPVELELYLNGHHWEIVGIVTHGRKDGLGVMFCDPQPAFYAAVVAAADVCPRDPRIHNANRLDETCHGESASDVMNHAHGHLCVIKLRFNTAQ